MAVDQSIAPRTQEGLRAGAITALATSSFVFVTAETLPVGLLPQIAHGLSVSQADVGLLLTTYAGVAALSTIPFTAWTMHLPRHRLLAALVAVFAVSQAAAALAPTFAILIVARLLCALAHGVFWSAITPAAARLGPPGQAGRITSLVFIGNSLALVLGVPLMTALGQAAGWRAAFATLAVAGALSTLALLRVLPALPAHEKDRTTRPAAHLRAATAVIGSPAITAVCAVTTVVVIGHFAAYTYIAPLVRHDGGLAGLGLSALLLGYGAAGLVGNILVGPYVDRHPGIVLSIAAGLVAVALAMLAVLHGGPATVVAVLVWGLGFSAVPVSLQSAVLRVAPAAQDAASAVYVVAFQIGIGGGALVGDRFVAVGHLGTLPVLGAIVAAGAVAIVLGARAVFPFRPATEVRPAADVHGVSDGSICAP